MKNICMLTTSFLDYDTRILNEAETLSRQYKLTIITKQYDKKKILHKTPFKVKRINYFQIKPYQFNIFSSLIALSLAAFKENPDVFHAHDLDGLLCLFLPALIKRKPLIYDSHELWSGMFAFSKIKGIKWFLPVLEKTLMLKVNFGITVNQSIAEILSEKYKKDFLVLRNCPKSERTKNNRFLSNKVKNKKIIVHVGGIGEGRGIEQIIKSANFLPKNIVLFFLGSEKEKINDNILFLTKLPPDKVVSSIKDADLGLALTQKKALSFYYSLPNKIFQYINAEVPILGSNFPEFKKVILDNNIGEVVDPSKPKQIAKKIKSMLEPDNQRKYRQNLKAISKDLFTWESESKKLSDFYEKFFKN